MSTDFRALCAELADAYLRLLEHINNSTWLGYEPSDDPLLLRTRAALAEPADGPAAVAEGPSDEEIMELMPQQMREDLAAAARAIAEQAGTDSRRAMGAMRIILNRHAVDLALAVLARWGQLPAPPAEGEVAELIKRLKYANQNGCIPSGISWGLADGSTHHKSTFITAEHGSDCGRAAELLERHAAPVPVPVAERLPGPEDCDAKGRCWLHGKVEGDWRLINPAESGVPHLRYCFSHWLPASDLPLPAPQGGEVE